jgi:sporulation protein YlmC with PRC-barrel domain
MPETAAITLFPLGALCGAAVHNREGESLGTITEVMIEPPSGRIAYAVLSWGGVLGVGEKLFAVPWSALAVDPEGQVLLDIAAARLEAAPGFDKDAWPTQPDPLWDAGLT